MSAGSLLIFSQFRTKGLEISRIMCYNISCRTASVYYDLIIAACAEENLRRNQRFRISGTGFPVITNGKEW